MFRQKQMERILEATRLRIGQSEEQEKIQPDKKDYISMLLAAVLTYLPVAIVVVVVLSLAVIALI